MFDKKLKELIIQLQSKGYKKSIDCNEVTSKPMSKIAENALKDISGGEVRVYAEFVKSL